MTDEELEALLDELENGLREEVQAALTLTADDFARAVDRATELTAAAFSVSRIGTMWRRRVSSILTALRRIATRGARATAEDLGEPMPRQSELDNVIDPYVEATRGLLDAVGDRLAADATQYLAEGVAAGESLPELKARMRTLFDDAGPELGPTRAARIAATEATRAFNAGALAAAQALTGEDRPLVKQWVTRRDERVRVAHRDADGQIQFLDDPFDVGGTPMLYPGDPSAPADLTINCRCIMRTATAPTERTASMADTDGTAEELQSRMPPQLKAYWLDGPGAVRIGWGTPGSFDRCVAELRDEFPQDPEGLCANLYHEATGRWPGQDNASEHTGAMIALIPSAEDAARLAVDNGEPVEELHVTLAYLGEAADWDGSQRESFRQAVRMGAKWLTVVQASAFGVAQWNPASDSPVWVYNVSDDRDASGSGLSDVHREISFQLEDLGYELPVQHSPWIPHVTGIYSSDRVDGDTMTDRLGPVRFDRIRVVFAGEYEDVWLSEHTPGGIEPSTGDVLPVMTATWSTPGDAALAFENTQTGDGRVFAPGALYWEGSGPWPLQYAGEMLGGHDGAELAGGIYDLSRDGNRITSSGVLYLSQEAGREATLLLAQGAPLGVSVDLDDVDLEMVDATGGWDAEDCKSFRTKLLTASVLPAEDGGFWLVGETAPEMAASSTGTMIESRKVRFVVGPDGTVPSDLIEIEAAAGDPDKMDGAVVDSQKSGEFLMRITRGRIRGATLVTIPAFAGARIVLDNPGLFASTVAEDGEVVAAASQSSDYERVLRHVRRSNKPVGAARVAQALRLPIVAAQRHLSRAAYRGEVVRIARGLYTDRTTSATADHVMMDDRTRDGLPGDMVASVTGAVDLPVADLDTEWDGDAAKDRVFQWADGDTSLIARAFAYRDDEADPTTKAAYKLGYADVDDGELVIIPKGVSAALGAVNGARGGVDIPADELDDVRAHLESVRAHVTEETGEDEMDDIQASAWTALSDAPPFPAAWFREPTIEELPPGGPGVNYANGRIFGWVAQAGEPHAGFAKKITIDGLGRIDTTHFLRQRFTLDDGSTVKAGAYTMNVGHHRDGAECETSACQFDDTRTVAGIVTVGMNERGMWFSGAAAPWLSEWDRAVFKATQPSYHLKKAPNGGWQLRAVLGVPVPGHSSPLLASAVIERSQLALTAAATMAEVNQAIEDETARQAAGEQPSSASATLVAAIDYDALADALVAAQQRAEERKAVEAAEVEELLALAASLDVDTTDEGA